MRLLSRFWPLPWGAPVDVRRFHLASLLHSLADRIEDTDTVRVERAEYERRRDSDRRLARYINRSEELAEAVRAAAPNIDELVRRPGPAWRSGQRAIYQEASRPLSGTVFDSYLDHGGFERVVFRPDDGLLFTCGPDELRPADDPPTEAGA